MPGKTYRKYKHLIINGSAVIASAIYFICLMLPVNVCAEAEVVKTKGITISLTKRPERDWRPSWSPDSAHITFESIDDVFNNIWIMDIKTRKLVPITHKRETPAFSIQGGYLTSFSYGVRWSLDPEKFLYVSSQEGNYDIWMCQIGEKEKLTHERLTKNKAWDGDPAWSPDGKKIVFVSNRSGNGDLWVMDLSVAPNDKNRLRQITFNPSIDFSPTWSPDGKYIFFTSKRMNNYEIYSYNLYTDGLNRLTTSDGMERFPSASPDGKWIACYSGRNLVVFSIHGSEVRVTAHDVRPDAEGPSWSPDSRHIVYVNDKDPTIYIADVEEMTSRKMTLPSFLHNSVKWSPDGQFLLFTSFMNGNNDICISPVQGKVKKRPLVKHFILKKFDKNGSARAGRKNFSNKAKKLWEKLF